MLGIGSFFKCKTMLYYLRNVKILHLRRFVSNFPESAYPIDCRNYTKKIGHEKPNYKEFLNARRKEANRSIVVQVNSDKSFPELYEYCSLFGNVIEAHHYKIPLEELHFILIQYDSEENLYDALKFGGESDNLSRIQTYSPFLWFKANCQRKFEVLANAPKILKSANGLTAVSDSTLFDLLNTVEKVEDQINVLYKFSKISDLSIRLRFLAALQIEKLISGIFFNTNIVPFGSSVNGFGKINCDLDLILKHGDKTECESTPSSRLVFHTKENFNNGRSQVQRQMECIGDILHMFVPGVSNVRRILQARVPIVKFHHDYLNLEVDFSMSTLPLDEARRNLWLDALGLKCNDLKTGTLMSELLFILGALDHRVRPLTFCIRKWAENSGLTNTSPGRWITNFSLTCLIIFFLQQVQNPILPPIDLLIKSSLTHRTTVSSSEINCTPMCDDSLLKFSTNNESGLSELLLQFFEFYSLFDFQNRAISLNEGRSVIKPAHSAIYIINPIEKNLNISKNISLEECERLRIEIRNAAWILESEVNKINGGDKSDTWGLINLFKQHQIVRPSMFFRSRMVEVKELFEENGNKMKKHQKVISKNTKIF